MANAVSPVSANATTESAPASEAVAETGAAAAAETQKQTLEEVQSPMEAEAFCLPSVHIQKEEVDALCPVSVDPASEAAAETGVAAAQAQKQPLEKFQSSKEAEAFCPISVHSQKEEGDTLCPASVDSQKQDKPVNNHLAATVRLASTYDEFENSFEEQGMATATIQRAPNEAAQSPGMPHAGLGTAAEVTLRPEMVSQTAQLNSTELVSMDKLASKALDENLLPMKSLKPTPRCSRPESATTLASGAGASSAGGTYDYDFEDQVSPGSTFKDMTQESTRLGSTSLAVDLTRVSGWPGQASGTLSISASSTSGCSSFRQATSACTLAVQEDGFEQESRDEACGARAAAEGGGASAPNESVAPTSPKEDAEDDGFEEESRDKGCSVGAARGHGNGGGASAAEGNMALNDSYGDEFEESLQEAPIRVTTGKAAASSAPPKPASDPPLRLEVILAQVAPPTPASDPPLRPEVVLATPKPASDPQLRVEDSYEDGFEQSSSDFLKPDPLPRSTESMAPVATRATHDREEAKTQSVADFSSVAQGEYSDFEADAE